MEEFSKDTLFNDLPQVVKQKIINLRNLSFPQNRTTNSIPLKKFGHVSIPSTDNLVETFLEMVSGSSNLAKGFDATESFKTKAAEFSEFVNLYRMAVDEVDFVAEIDKTIGLMQNKYEKLVKELNLE